MDNKTLFIFVAGLGLGAVGGFFFAKSKYQKAAEEEITEMREYYANKSFVKPPSVPEKPSPEEVERNYIMTNYESLQRPYKGNMNDSEAPFEADEIEDLDDIGNAQQEELRENAKLAPKLISSDDFGEFPNYDQTTLYFYTEDRTLVAEDEELVDDVDGLIGDALSKFGFAESDETSIYVRNYRLQTDYEVVKVFDSYGNGD